MKEKTFERRNLKVKVVSENRDIPQRIRSETLGVLKHSEKTSDMVETDEGFEFTQSITVNSGYPAKYTEILQNQEGGALHGLSVFMLCKILQRESGYESLEGITVEPTEDWTRLRPDVRIEGSNILGEAGFVNPEIGFSSSNSVAVMDKFVSLACDYHEYTDRKPVGMKLFHIPFRHNVRRKSIRQLGRSDIPRRYRLITAKMIED